MMLKRFVAAVALVFAFHAGLVFFLAWLLTVPLVLRLLESAFSPGSCWGELAQALALLGQLSLLIAVICLALAVMMRPKDVVPSRADPRSDRYDPDSTAGGRTCPLSRRSGSSRP